MRVSGYNLLAIAGAALAIYLVGYVIYALLVDPELWRASARITEADMDAVGASRLVFSPFMPLATAIGMAILFRWAQVGGLQAGVRYGALVALLSAVPAIWYGWVYGVGNTTGPLIDSAHLLIGHMAAGGILATWK